MSTWNDTTTFNDKKLQIMKRAQLVIADLWACANASKEETEFTKLEKLSKVSQHSEIWSNLEKLWKCNFIDIDQLTAFADYRVPQTLLESGALQYSEKLIKLLKGKSRYTRFN